MSETNLRLLAAFGGLIAGALFILVLSLLLSPPQAGDTTAASGVLLGMPAVSESGGSPSDGSPTDGDERDEIVYPFTIQNLMWLLFFVGLSDVLVRFLRGGRELRQMELHLLPEDDQTMLRAKDLGDIYARANPRTPGERNFLQRLIVRIVLQFQSSRSVDQSNALLNSSLELLQHEIELKYNMMRYMVWLIPTLGFIGTVVGIAQALGRAGKLPDTSDQIAVSEWMMLLTGKLAVAFNTTLVALLLSAVLVFLMHVAQGREESALNRAGQYCLDNLINRLYEK